jgi:hypothetical protein
MEQEPAETRVGAYKTKGAHMKKLCFAAITLLAAFMFAACGEVSNESDTRGSPYTFKFQVEYKTYDGSYIKKIEFLDGTNLSARVLGTETENLINNARSDTYTVRGFREKDGDNKRKFGVLVTFGDDTTFFNWSSESEESKILVTVERKKESLWSDKFVLSMTFGGW